MENETNKSFGFKARFYGRLISEEGEDIEAPAPDWILVAWLDETQPYLQNVAPEYGGVYRRDNPWSGPLFHIIPPSFKQDWEMIDRTVKEILWGQAVDSLVYGIELMGLTMKLTIGVGIGPIEADLVNYWPVILLLTFVRPRDYVQSNQMSPEEQIALWWMILANLNKLPPIPTKSQKAR